MPACAGMTGKGELTISLVILAKARIHLGAEFGLAGQQVSLK